MPCARMIIIKTTKRFTGRGEAIIMMCIVLRLVDSTLI
jgi:hypothetical protein